MIEKYEKVETTVNQSITNVVSVTGELLITMTDMYLTIENPEEFTATMLSKYENTNLTYAEKVERNLTEHADEIRKNVCTGVNNLKVPVRNSIADLWIEYKREREKGSDLEECLKTLNHMFRLHARLEGMKRYLLTLCDDTVEFVKMVLKEEEV